MIDRYSVERVEKWREIAFKIPFLSFPPDWEVRIMPPFSGAMGRFCAKLRGQNEDKSISVYLDWNDALGFVGQPYWEAYPIRAETERFLLAETDQLISAIDKALRATP